MRLGGVQLFVWSSIPTLSTLLCIDLTLDRYIYPIRVKRSAHEQLLCRCWCWTYYHLISFPVKIIISKLSKRNANDHRCSCPLQCLCLQPAFRICQDSVSAVYATYYIVCKLPLESVKTRSQLCMLSIMLHDHFLVTIFSVSKWNNFS